MKYEKLEIELVEFDPNEVVWKPDELSDSTFTCPIGKSPCIGQVTDNGSKKQSS